MTTLAPRNRVERRLTIIARLQERLTNDLLIAQSVFDARFPDDTPAGQLARTRCAVLERQLADLDAEAEVLSALLNRRNGGS